MGDLREVWLVTDQAAGGGAAAGGGGAREGGRFTGAVAGWYRLELPDRENLDRAQLDLMVHPDRRRRGLGRMLLQHAAARAAAHTRSVPRRRYGTRSGSASASIIFCRASECGTTRWPRDMTPAASWRP